jgi:hypothetical protein
LLDDAGTRRNGGLNEQGSADTDTERQGAQQAAARRAETRRRMLIAGGSVAVVLALANMITAAICKLTHGQPGNVCTSAGVTAASRSI